MTANYLDIAFTPDVQAKQLVHGSRAAYARALARHAVPARDGFTQQEELHVASCDTFFIATVSETGWPYVQHRGGPSGFVHVFHGADEAGTRLAWAEYSGNRQYVTAGNATHDGRVAMIFLDFAHRRRLKVMGRLTAYSPEERPDIVLQVAPSDESAIDQVMVVEVEAFDWNCPQHITPRFTLAEIEEMKAPLRARIREIKTEYAGK